MLLMIIIYHQYIRKSYLLVKEEMSGPKTVRSVAL